MKKYIYLLAAFIILAACTREDDDVVNPVLFSEFPQLILFDDEEGSEPEDSDEFSVVITLADRFDPTGEELGGEIIPLDEAVVLDFSIDDLEGFSNLDEYILGAQAFNEIDDNITSLDEGDDLLISFDTDTGDGQVTFPAGVEEIILLFSTDDTFFDDEIVNEDRGFSINISGDGNQDLQVLDAPFEFMIMDDEAESEE